LAVINGVNIGNLLIIDVTVRHIGYLFVTHLHKMEIVRGLRVYRNGVDYSSSTRKWSQCRHYKLWPLNNDYIRITRRLLWRH